ncbi:hypothetical protein S40288_11666, partial [Stachybotrys chartarum IBT 40288]
KVLGA